MKRRRLTLLLAVVFLPLMAGSTASLWWRTRHPLTIQYSDSFAQHSISEWNPYGGSWKIEDTAIVVSSAESGAKIVTGRPQWADYELSADVQLRGHTGDVGVVVRARNAGIGAEAIQGYVVSLRSSDAGLQITRAAQHWLSLAPEYLPGGVQTYTWYHLRVIVAGCHVVAEARNAQTSASATASFEDTDSLCLHTGRVALRTTATDAAWKNIRVVPASDADATALARRALEAVQPAYPIRERDYSAMRERYLALVPETDLNRPTQLGGFGSMARLQSLPILSVADFRSSQWNTGLVHIVGVVTSTNPLYVQDASAGIRVDAPTGETFRVGDEIEMLGHASPAASPMLFRALAGRFLWDRVPLAPVSLTATQAASGRFDGTFVELNGRVRGTAQRQNGVLELLLEEQGQLFNVQVPYDLFRAAPATFERGSQVRVRGVCSTEIAGTMGSDAFSVYAGSGTEVVLLTGPPWWTGRRLVILAGLSFFLFAGAVLAFGMNERAKLQLLQEERERLSHDMHDTLAQSLAGVGFRLQGIHRSLRDSASVPELYVNELKATCDLVAQTHREASSQIAALHPAAQKNVDLLTHLERAVYTMLDDEEFPVIVSSEGTEQKFSPVVADTLFRVGREAIANALRHSQASFIKVRLVYRKRTVTLTIADDGVGFAYEASHTGFGIRSMERRCEGIKAQLTISAAPGNGCRVEVKSPYRVHRGLVRWVG